MVGFNNNEEDAVLRQRALDWVDEASELVRTLLWEDGPPSGMTVMDDGEEQTVLEEVSLLAARGGTNNPMQQVQRHPAIAQRIRELEAEAREEATA